MLSESVRKEYGLVESRGTHLPKTMKFECLPKLFLPLFMCVWTELRADGN